MLIWLCSACKRKCVFWPAGSVAETILTACPAPPPPINTDYPPSLLYLDPDSANLYKHLDLGLRFEIRPTSDKLDQALPTPSILGR